MKLTLQIKKQYYQAIITSEYIVIPKEKITILKRDIIKIRKINNYYIIYFKNKFSNFSVSEAKVEKNKKILDWYDPNFLSRKIISFFLGFFHFILLYYILDFKNIVFIALSSIFTIFIFYSFFSQLKKKLFLSFYKLIFIFLSITNFLLSFYSLIYFYYFLICFLLLAIFFIFLRNSNRNKYRKIYIIPIWIFTIFSYYAFLFSFYSISQEIKKHYALVHKVFPLSIYNTDFIFKKFKIEKKDYKIELKEISYIERYFSNYKFLLKFLPMYKGTQIISPFYNVDGYFFIIPSTMEIFFTDFLYKIKMNFQTGLFNSIVGVEEIPSTEIRDGISYMGYKIIYKKGNIIRYHYYFGIPFIFDNKQYFLLFCFNSYISQDVQYYYEFILNQILVVNNR